MKQICLLGLLVALSGCASTNTHAEPPTGPMQVEQLLAEHDKFQQAYQAYQPTEAEIAAMQRLAGKRIVVLFGTWCHDSQREVGRLLKLIEVAKPQLAELKLVAADYQKHIPDGLHQRLNLVYTPTIYLFDGQTELGRVIERPMGNLAEDLAGFLPQG